MAILRLIGLKSAKVQAIMLRTLSREKKYTKEQHGMSPILFEITKFMKALATM